MDIVIDFDGTVVTHEFPKVGRDIGAMPVLRAIVENGHKLILFTMRSDRENDGMYLTDAVNWFAENNIPLHGIQVNPTQHKWTTSPKAYGALIIDDAALGCPLIHGQHDRPYVDWDKVNFWLQEMQIIK